MQKILIILMFISLFWLPDAYAQDDIQELKSQLEEQQKLIQKLRERIELIEKQREAQNVVVTEKPQPKNDVEPTLSREPLSNLVDRTYQLNKRFSDFSVPSIGSTPFSQYKFVPDIALIVDISLVTRNVNDDLFKSLEIPGFIHEHVGDEHGHSHGMLNAEKGFNFNYGELSMASTVDPYFDLFATFHLTEESFEVEEAYATTRSLPLGFQLKAGKFLSSIGRLNAQHTHYWDFADQPLVYKTFFGEHGLLEKGVQLTWLSPLNTYLLFGIESLQGENEGSFGNEGFNYAILQNGTTKKVADTDKPNVWLGFVKSSVDIGNLTLLGGLSYAYGKSRIDHLEEEYEPHAFAGNTNIYGVDLTARYSIDSYRYFLLQAEYLYRKMDGTKYAFTDTDGDEIPDTTVTPQIVKKQSGLYSQLVYKFSRQWRAGFRYDLLNKNDIYVDHENLSLPDNMPRYSFMVDYSPTEFSRLRLQANHDRSKYLENNRKTVNEVFLQLTIAIGAHGAHSF